MKNSLSCASLLLALLGSTAYADCQYCADCGPQGQKGCRFDFPCGDAGRVLCGIANPGCQITDGPCDRTRSLGQKLNCDAQSSSDAICVSKAGSQYRINASEKTIGKLQAEIQKMNKHQQGKQ